MKTNRLRIKLRAYDFNILDNSVQEIVQTAKNTGARVAGPIPLPTEINKYTVLDHLTLIKNHVSSSK
jgi:small subunit ribosomal protein S10